MRVTKTVLRWANVTAIVLGAIVASPNIGRAQTPVVITFDKLVEYVQLGVSDERLIGLVETSPTKFVLGADQITQLRQAGGSEKLIAAVTNSQAKVEVGSDVRDFVVILDCSGSMNDTLPDGISKWSAAREAAREFIHSIPEGRNLAVVVYGTDLARKCQSVDILRSLGPLTASDKIELNDHLNALRAVGQTPIARSLQVAGQQLELATGMSSIVLITDGMESCHGNPAAEAARLTNQFPNLKSVNVVGFCLGDAETTQVAQIAKSGHGEFYDSTTAAELTASLRKIERSVVRAGLFGEVNYESLSPVDRMLIEQLSDPSLTAREEAAKAIGARKLHAAVPALIRLILDAPWETTLSAGDDRDAALKALQTLAPEKVAPTLSEALNSPQYGVRVWTGEAVVEHQVVDAIDAVKARLFAMGDRDIEPHLINGEDEADALLSAVRKLAPNQVDEVLVRLLKSTSANKKAWAATQLQ